MSREDVDVPLAEGTSIGRYVVRELVGRGGMGEVYRAHDAQLGRDVAIKVLPPGLPVDAERLRRFEQEARAAAALNHPNILAVYDVGAHDGAPYVVSELLRGRDAARRARAAARCRCASAVDYARPDRAAASPRRTKRASSTAT